MKSVKSQLDLCDVTEGMLVIRQAGGHVVHRLICVFC